ncbi:hypothetical protein Hamer_G017613 [Homarus americanus]|uniref:Uncharacterized protein n=1 Tax=Homarus americanus TaxID=6706 RepID=A0A8J5MK48_HOMAM|nr:hypothetical protein Hamer_G017613 [Homarus americanus]
MINTSPLVGVLPRPRDRSITVSGHIRTPTSLLLRALDQSLGMGLFTEAPTIALHHIEETRIHVCVCVFIKHDNCCSDLLTRR